jgi:hypothetical protein
MDTKVCTRCGVEKSVKEFYKHKYSRNGLRGWCKQCEKEYVAAYQKTDKGKETRKRYDQSPKGRANQKRCDSSPQGIARHSRYNTSEKGRAYSKKVRKVHPRRAKARDAVNNAVKDDRLPHVSTLLCVRCGKQAEEYHHHKGYDKKHRLDVQPVCIVCHRAIDNGELD